MDELEKLVEADDTAASGEEKVEETKTEPQKSEALLKEEQKLENLQRATAEALKELQDIRKQKQEAKPEDDTPKINFEDPAAKAWDKHIVEKVDPLQAELRKEKEEVVSLALDEFLQDRPALAQNPEKRRELIETYQALAQKKGISERNKDVVKSVLSAAYGAVFSQEVLERERKQRLADAKAEGAIADAAIDGGGTSYRSDSKPRRRQLSREETALAVKMYGSLEDYWQAVEKLSQ